MPSCESSHAVTRSLQPGGGMVHVHADRLLLSVGRANDSQRCSIIDGGQGTGIAVCKQPSTLRDHFRSVRP
jgi:hypothetical protein